MSVLEVMGSDGLGGSEPITQDMLAAFVRTEYLDSQREKARVEHSRILNLYYNAGGDEQIVEMIGTVFKDREIIAKRSEWVSRAKYNNVLRRIVNELSTVYAEPARRTVELERDNLNYQIILSACGIHEKAIFWNRMANLHRACAVGFKVRNVRGELVPSIDVVTPDNAHVIPYPDDRTRMAAIILKTGNAGPRVSAEAGYLVWTDDEVFRLTKMGHVMSETWKPNPFGRIPWSLVSFGQDGCVLPATPNADLRAAHESVWFENVCLLKESKSATKIPTVAGDVSNMARAQAADTENAVQLTDGATVSVLDMSMDLAMFRDTARSIYETAAANYGLPPSILSHQGVQSADARELMRLPLRELRREQQIPFRRFEKDFAEVMSAVCAVDMPALSFSTAGWRIDFGEGSTPLGTKESIEVFEQERRLGLTSTVKEIMRRNPDITPEGAEQQLAEDILAEDLRIELMKPQREGRAVDLVDESILAFAPLPGAKS